VLDRLDALAAAPFARVLISSAEYQISELEDGAGVDDAVPFLLGTAMGILLHQLGRLVLHASAVAVNGRAVLLCGRSGVGKSTLAAALNQSGYPLLLDDFCCVEMVDGKPLAHPDGRQVKLWAQAIDELGLGERREGPVRHRMEKFYVEPLGPPQGAALPIGAVYHLCEASPTSTPGITPVNVVDASLILRRNAYRPLLIDTMGLRQSAFQIAAAISSTARTFQLVRPNGFDAMDSVIEQLRTHWQELAFASDVA
jgi:hypothetical protein